MEEAEKILGAEPDQLANTMAGFFRVAGGIVLSGEGLPGLANAVGGYATYHALPEDVKAAMLAFEGAIREASLRT